MKTRQFYTFKFKSSRLKEFDYDINLTFDEAKENNEVIALFDSQVLRSIRDIHKREIDYDNLEGLHKKRNYLRKQEHSDSNVAKIQSIQDKINKVLYMPEYITIVMDHNSHYTHLYKNGLRLNGKIYKRFNSSASQSRTSTVTFCEEKTVKELHRIMDNGRDKTIPMAPSKFNAYKGLAGSSTKVVPTPRFALVPDYESKTEFNAHFVTENDDWDKDDTMEETTITELFDRFDGQGLISVEQSKKWAKELELDYVPAQWCIRQNYIKGMLCTFDIHKFCEEENSGNYTINTSYKDEGENPITADLRDIDVILSESQFKLWDSFPSIEVYEKNCEDNNLKWGVTLYTPKQDKDILSMNYQFMQTLNLNKKDIEKVSEKFVDWITGISSENIYYTLLFLMGENVTEEKIDRLINHGENYWVKSLLLNHNLINDKYIKRKIHDMVKRKIQRACLGDIIVDGNFQVIVSDPYAQMQHVCGHDDVTGLLGAGEYYSNYWNKKGVKKVDSMRSPLTYRSEHVLLDLKESKNLNEWYKYCYTGILVNIHGDETVRWAGSDFDYDILATTSDPTVISGVYQDELPVVYEAPKPEKQILTEEALYKSDLFSFGSIIGSITNKSTSGYALLSELKEGTDEYDVTLNRIRMCTKLQSAQIDKAKIGENVKGIPSPWTKYQKVNGVDVDSVKDEKEFLNSILLDKHPYFFTYLYPDTKRKYKTHYKKYDVSTQQKFGMTLEELKSLKRKTKEQIDFLHLFEKYSPVNDSECVMNNLCRYIETVDFKIKNIVSKNEEVYHQLLMSSDFSGVDEDKYKKVVEVYSRYRSNVSSFAFLNSSSKKDGFDEEKYISIIGHYEKFKKEMNEVCSNVVEAVDYLIYMFYVDEGKFNKDILWNIYGEQIYQNIKSNTKEICVPVEDETGSFTYLNKRYNLRKVEL
ncbi:hypothetical protein CIL05_06920 [Virgibacillus profundi]|uniref:RDRP core domain-containing protein n=1 Tax=Virgibacillus profundi TaxID=2024555 RepID=A0A2A2IGH8_9BACI|nr:hypothetical protein [Virgibacillus profundi]PAV30193.1 hypothetical protein CIL05_06920 [Virgibacillus profundi]PXY54365.1 hypothetical protein CIT14_07005 [Virgibacillus profundi]